MSLCNSVNVINHEWLSFPCGEGGEDKNNMVRSNKGCHLVYHTARKTSKHCGFHTGNALSLHMKYGTTHILQYVFFYLEEKKKLFMESSIKNYRDKAKDFGATSARKKKPSQFFVAPLRNFSVKEAAFVTFIYLDPGGRGSLLLCKVLLYTIANCSGSTCCCIYFFGVSPHCVSPKITRFNFIILWSCFYFPDEKEKAK